MIYNLGILMLAPVHIIVCGIWVKSAIDDREKSLADYIVYFFMLALYYWQYKIISDGFTYTWGHKTELSGKIAIPLVISLVLTTLLFLCVPRKNRSWNFIPYLLR